MTTVLLCPVMFNLAETTRMIQVARALDDLTPVFMGYEHDYVHLITDAGFEYRAGEPAWTDAERDQAMAFDQGRSFKSPFTEDLVTARVDPRAGDDPRDRREGCGDGVQHDLVPCAPVPSMCRSSTRCRLR